MQQVWNWFQNRRYALRAKAARTSVPGQVNMPSVPRDDQSVVRNVPQAPQPQVSQPPPAPQSNIKFLSFYSRNFLLIYMKSLFTYLLVYGACS